MRRPVAVSILALGSLLTAVGCVDFLGDGGAGDESGSAPLGGAAVGGGGSGGAPLGGAAIGGSSGSGGSESGGLLASGGAGAGDAAGGFAPLGAGGSSPGGAAAGGLSTGGVDPDPSGGALLGGGAPSGGLPAGGISSGGVSSGGDEPGGTTSGGVAEGGTVNGGAAMGGLAAAGAPTGGIGTGGIATGGTATGGTATGGTATGGTATGGAGGVNACDGGPLATSLPNCTPPEFVLTGDFRQDCVDRINEFRAQCQCLPPLARWPEAEDCADQMAAYDAEVDDYHAGFNANVCSPRGTAQNECPGWPSEESIIVNPQWFDACLTQMWHEVDDPAGEQGHYVAMSNTRYTKVACGFTTAADGTIWSVQNFSQ